MRAAVVRAFGGADCIEVVSNFAKPVISASNEVLIRVKSSGINPVDTYIRSGQYSALPELPYVVGRDGAGIVEEAGSDAKFKKGDRVFFFGSPNGTAAEYCLSTKAFSLPDGVDFSQGASLPIPYLTAFRALFIKGKPKPGANVLVHGASGGVGLAACQLGSWKGLNIAGTAGSDEGLKLIQENGAKSVYNHRATGCFKKLKTDFPNGFDLILEMNAHENLGHDLEMLALGGQVAVIGSRGNVNIAPRNLMATEGSVFGVALSYSTPAEYDEMGEELVQFLKETKFRPVVGKHYSLDEIQQAHRDIMSSKKHSYGKYVVDF